LQVSLGLVADDSGYSKRLVQKLEETEEVTRVVRAENTAAMTDLILAGAIDVGLSVEREAGEAPAFTLYQDATRQAAGFAAEKALARLAPEADVKGATLDRREINPVNANAPMPAYFAAGVAMLFLFLSGFQTALSLIEERESGLLARIAASRGGAGAVVDGKFVFITLQGIAQVGVILATAAIVFGVDLSHAPLALVLATIAASIGAAGLTLGITALCGSRPQAHAVGTVLSLVFAAIGGSMAPAFLMPGGIQTIGAFTPNGLGVHAFGASLWAGGGLGESMAPIIALIAYGLAGLIVARIALAPNRR
jgi:ABC-2 type transport system permease protein